MTATAIDQRVYFVGDADKRALLHELLRDQTMKRVIVFTHKHGANKVAEHLAMPLRRDAIHGNKSQNARQRALEGFRAGRARILVRPTLPPAGSISTT